MHLASFIFNSLKLLLVEHYIKINLFLLSILAFTEKSYFVLNIIYLFTKLFPNPIKIIYRQIILYYTKVSTYLLFINKSTKFISWKNK